MKEEERGRRTIAMLLPFNNVWFNGFLVMPSSVMWLRRTSTDSQGSGVQSVRQGGEGGEDALLRHVLENHVCSHTTRNPHHRASIVSTPYELSCRPMR